MNLDEEQIRLMERGLRVAMQLGRLGADAGGGRSRRPLKLRLRRVFKPDSTTASSHATSTATTTDEEETDCYESSFVDDSSSPPTGSGWSSAG